MESPLDRIAESPPDGQPDTETTSEAKDLENARKEAELANLKQDVELRKTYSNRFFWLMCVYLLVVELFLIGAGLKSLTLSDTVLVTLLSTTTANIVGILIVVARYIFPDHKK